MVQAAPVAAVVGGPGRARRSREVGLQAAEDHQVALGKGGDRQGLC